MPTTEAQTFRAGYRTLTTIADEMKTASLDGVDELADRLGRASEAYAVCRARIAAARALLGEAEPVAAGGDGDDVEF